MALSGGLVGSRSEQAGVDFNNVCLDSTIIPQVQLLGHQCDRFRRLLEGERRRSVC